ncbi:MAG: helix-turn-helix transcriptional regulator [Armatimonadota bacterium]
MLDAASWRKLRLRCAHVSRAKPALMVGGRRLGINSIGFDMMPPGFTTYQHAHSSYELTVFLHGDARYIDQMKEEAVERGHLFLFHPQQKHAWRVAERACTRFVVLFTIEPAITISIPERWPISHILADEVERFSDELLHLYSRELLSISSRVMTITSHALSLFDADNVRVTAKTRKPDLLETVEHLITGDLSRRWSQDEIAQQVGMSVRHVTRLFRQMADTTLTSFIRQVRLDHARYLLRETDEKISEVCARSGMTDHGYFYRCFQQYCGMSPQAYRRMNRQQQVPEQNSGCSLNDIIGDMA